MKSKDQHKMVMSRLVWYKRKVCVKAIFADVLSSIECA